MSRTRTLWRWAGVTSLTLFFIIAFAVGPVRIGLFQRGSTLTAAPYADLTDRTSGYRWNGPDVSRPATIGSLGARSYGSGPARDAIGRNTLPAGSATAYHSATMVFDDSSDASFDSSECTESATDHAISSATAHAAAATQCQQDTASGHSSLSRSPLQRVSNRR
jgi:hypothetical protein